MRRHASIGLVFGIASMFSACAHSAPATAPVAPLTPEQQQAFDGGVDFVASLEGLEGRWRDDWNRDLETRVQAANLIALVTVRTLRTDTDPQQQITHRLIAQVDRALLGDKKSGELVLAVRADELGFNSVHDNLSRIADRQYIAYVKATPGGTSWHLSPASEQIVNETESKITQLERGTKQVSDERVIVHTN